MTDRPASPGDDAVELASRYLDGDLSVDERAAAETDPDVMAWVERFGGIQAALREPIDVDARARDAAIAAALTELDQTSPIESAPPPGRDELAAARARRAGRLGKWLGTAAAVAALAIGGAVLAANSRGDGDDSADEPTLSAANRLDESSTAAADEQRASADMTMSEAPSPARESATAAGSGDARDSAAPSTVAAGAAPAAPAATDQDTSGGGATETSAGAATTAASTSETTVVPFTTGPRSYRVPADLQPLANVPPLTVPEGTDAPCADQAVGELVDIDVFYADQPAAVYRDIEHRTLTAWAVNTCEPLGEYTYPAE